MHPKEKAALEDARALVPDAERILGVSGLDEQFRSFEHNEAALHASAERDIGLGDLASIAGLLVSLVAYLHQVVAEQFLKNVSREELVQELCHRLLDRADLPPDTKERLVVLAIEKIIPDRR